MRTTIVEIVDGELFHSGPAEPFSTMLLVDHVLQGRRNRGIASVPLPEHPCPGTEVAAFTPADESRWEPNIVLPGRERPLLGPLAIAGRGEHRLRYLTSREAGVYRLRQATDEEFPRLVVRDCPT